MLSHSSAVRSCLQHCPAVAVEMRRGGRPVDRLDTRVDVDRADRPCCERRVHVPPSHSALGFGCFERVWPAQRKRPEAPVREVRFTWSSVRDPAGTACARGRGRNLACRVNVAGWTSMKCVTAGISLQQDAVHKGATGLSVLDVTDLPQGVAMARRIRLRMLHGSSCFLRFFPVLSWTLSTSRHDVDPPDTVAAI